MKKYQEISRKGGWGRIMLKGSLYPGDVNEFIPVIRKRLMIAEDLSDQQKITDTFDFPLASAIKRFQNRHGIEPTGIIKQSTVVQMNVSVEERIKQIEINIQRWINFNTASKLNIIVNLPSQVLELRQSDSVLMSMKVIVGRPSRRTPVISGYIKQVEFNPFWVIPPGITRKDILPKIREDTSFLADEGIQVYRGGRKATSDSLDWESTDGYRFIQAPGPTNPMGQVKFSFPNKYFVYMHDTPNKELFKKERRAFSSGCIRLSCALELAYFILETDKKLSRTAIDSIVASQKNCKIMLTEPIEINIVYFTAWVSKEDEIMFARDIYYHDREVRNKSKGG